MAKNLLFILRFGVHLTPATVVNSTAIACVSPSHSQAQVSVEMGVQCDGVYTELDEDTRLAGVDAALMHKKCGEVREVVGLLL